MSQALTSRCLWHISRNLSGLYIDMLVGGIKWYFGATEDRMHHISKSFKRLQMLSQHSNWKHLCIQAKGVFFHNIIVLKWKQDWFVKVKREIILCYKFRNMSYENNGNYSQVSQRTRFWMPTLGDLVPSLSLKHLTRSLLRGSDNNFVKSESEV